MTSRQEESAMGGRNNKRIETVDTNTSLETPMEANLKDSTKKCPRAREEVAELSAELKNVCLDDGSGIKPSLAEVYKCLICFEIQIKPTVLNCCHIFCEWCIRTWLRKKRKCPICRKLVLTTSYRIDLDYFLQSRVAMEPVEVSESYKALAEKRDRERPKGVQSDDEHEVLRILTP